MVAGGGTMASAPPPAIGGNGGCTGVSANISNLTGTTTPGTTTMAASPQGTNEGGPTRTRTSENRRSNKPIMEKRRRARINNCLNELKTLILDAMKKDPARHSKLEKADILEMTVKHLEALQRQQVAMAAVTDPNVANKFRAGFTECAGEVGRFPGLEGPVKRRLLQHLANCLNSTSPPTGSAAVTPTTAAANPVESGQPSTTPPITTSANGNPPLQVHILRTPPQGETQGTNSNIILTNTNGQGVQLVPTRLPNGNIALILPSSNSFRSTRTTTTTTAPVTPSSSPSPSVSSNSSGSSPLPMLIPIPQRTNTDSPPIALDRLSMNSTSPPQQITIVTAQTPQRFLIPHQQTSTNGKGVSLVTYQCGEEHVVPHKVIMPDAEYQKSDKTISMMRGVDSSLMHGPRKDVVDVYDDRVPSEEEGLYDRNRLIMTHDGRIIDREEHGIAIYGGTKKNIYSPGRETLIHIPEKDSYYESYSPRSPIGYVEAVEDHHKYGEYYPEHFDDRSCSPDMPKPLALVMRKKCEEYGNEERPWRPW